MFSPASVMYEQAMQDEWFPKVHIKSFGEVVNQSTCKKRVTVVELYDKNNLLLVRESNRCNPTDGICSRLGISQDKANYDVNSTCNWTHAEIMAINALLDWQKPYKAILYGHDFYCQSCEDKLREKGVEVFEISDKKL